MDTAKSLPLWLHTVRHHPKAAKLQKALNLIGLKTICWLLIGVLSAFVLAGIEIAMTLILQTLLQALGLLAQNAETISFFPNLKLSASSIVVALLGIAFIRSGALFLQNMSGAIAYDQIILRLRQILIYRMLKSDQEQLSNSTVNSFLGDVFPGAANFAQAAANTLGQTMQALIIASMMFKYAWREAALAFLALGFIGLLSAYLGRFITSHARILPKLYSNLTQSVERICRNWLLVKVLRTQESEYARLASYVHNFSQNSIKLQKVRTMRMILPGFSGTILICIIIYLSQNVWQTPGMHVVAMLYMLIRLTQNLTALSSSSSNLLSNLPRFRTAYDLYDKLGFIDFTLHSTHSQQISSIPCHTKSVPPAITLNKVSFNYSNSSQCLISNFSLSILPGEHVAIVGPSGCGKSTLLSLILGLLRPSVGEVLVNNQPASHYWGSADIRVGYVGPDPFILAGTIRENLLYGNQLPSNDQCLIDALKAAHLYEDLQHSKKTLDYTLSSSGDGLSAGQKQRLALARALANHPSLLVLDEPTANVDPITETLIADTLLHLKGCTTCIIISHREGAIAHADLTIDMSKVTAKYATEEQRNID